MRKQKLNYRFHDPNPRAVTADYLLKIFMEANENKVQRAIENAADIADSEEIGHSTYREPFLTVVKIIILR